jgi:serpin B
MVALGARGATLDEISKALGVDPDPAKNVAAAKAESQAWNSAAGKAELVIANRLWLNSGFSVAPDFVSGAKVGYGAVPVTVDFLKAPDPSRIRINAWVSETTKGRIKDLLPPRSVTPATSVVLTNAIYFKGTWDNAFDKKGTKNEPFHAESGDVNVAMMHRRSSVGYAETEGARVVELAYKDSDLSMLVVLPKKTEELGAIESALNAPKIEGWAKSVRPTLVSLTMPKFTFSWGRSVKPELQELGIRLAFTDKADLSGIASANATPLAISDVFHKAFVLVDETGTEAAAATGTVIRATAAVLPVEVKLDRPFLFFIRNAKTGDVLFAGRLAVPPRAE